MKKLESKTLNEIIIDFLRSGLDINIESFGEWIGINLDEKDLELVDTRIYKLN